MNCFYCALAGAVIVLSAQCLAGLVCLWFPRDQASDEIGGDA